MATAVHSKKESRQMINSVRRSVTGRVGWVEESSGGSRGKEDSAVSPFVL